MSVVIIVIIIVEDVSRSSPVRRGQGRHVHLAIPAYPSTFPLLSPQLNLHTSHQLLFTMASGLHHMSQAASGSTQLKTQMDPTLQAQATALRLLAARADKLRDSILNLLNIIQQDPVGDRTRQSILPW